MSVFEINVSNLIYNVNIIKQRLGNNVKLCAMVKSDAYGHNAKIICPQIENMVDYFGVATINEGVDLRMIGTKNNILCVGKFQEKDLEFASYYKIEIVVESIDDVKKLIEYKNYKFLVHLKIDVGMHRLGFINIKEFKNAILLIKKQSNIKIVGVFTHFAVSDEKYYIDKQKEFNKYLKICPKDVMIHCSNSLASRYNFLQYNMVRVGLSLYGYGESHLRKVLKVKSKVISLRCVKAGESVGYNKLYIAKYDIIVATIFLGYYDGVNRKLSNNAVVFINNKKYKIIGNICMDMFMVKVDEMVAVGDEVVVFYDANYWAKIINTIPYEVLTSLRYNRCEIKLLKDESEKQT